tara:strand:+ start:4262 stop:4537 length:276 start_codon:yes stop_codon:yes gene_type:complete
LQDNPYKCTGIIALVFLVIYFSIKVSSILFVIGSISTNTGLAPTDNIEFTVATNVNPVVITSSPFPMLLANNAICKAVVPDEVATEYLTPK